MYSVNVFKEINFSLGSLLNTDFTLHVLLYLIQCNFSKMPVCSLLSLVSNAWFPLLIYSPLLFLFFSFLQLKNALLILTWTFLFPSQWAWRLDSLSFLSLYLTSLEEEKVVLAISLYNLLIPSLLPTFPILFPFPDSLTCPLKKKRRKTN